MVSALEQQLAARTAEAAEARAEAARLRSALVDAELELQRQVRLCTVASPFLACAHHTQRPTGRCCTYQHMHAKAYSIINQA